MEGGVRWAVRGALEKDKKDYWARVTLADLEVLANRKNGGRRLQGAVAVADKDWFKLTSSREQLQLLQDLGFRPEEVKCGLEMIERHLRRITAPEKSWTPRQVFLFSGHMIDAPDRKEPRFPATRRRLPRKPSLRSWMSLKPAPDDLAFCGGACGGDLLFAEACLARGARRSASCLRRTDVSATVRRFCRRSWVERYYQSEVE